MFNTALLEIISCPITKGPLYYDVEKNLLISPEARIAYRIDMGIPILLIEEAIPLEEDHTI